MDVVQAPTKIRVQIDFANGDTAIQPMMVHYDHTGKSFVPFEFNIVHPFTGKTVLVREHESSWEYRNKRLYEEVV